MKKVQTIIMLATMSVALCACGKNTIETKNTTESATEQKMKLEINTESSATEENKTENQNEDENNLIQNKKASYAELDNILDEINNDIKPGTAGSGLTSIKVAAHLLNWGVGTSMGTDEIKKETLNWLSDKGNTEQVAFLQKLASVYDAYHKLLGPDANQLLVDAGYEDVPFSWSTSPVETIEAIVEVVQLPEDMTDMEEDSSKNDTDISGGSECSGPDVAELVNLRGDETTVYLLADGRYMDRTNTVYIYDGVDTWTDESGVEWNKVVK